MKRIAKVKFGSKSKQLYDYICEDESIEPGDVVFVEGKDYPLYVYEVEKMMDSLCKATKKVIKRAIENPNVSLETRYMNIINCDCESIVNSLGPKTSVFGNICKAIVSNAKSGDIELMLAKNSNANIFDVFVTDAGNLPSKHIIHIVMPFKNDDEDNQNLKDAFSKVIDKAIELGYKSIGIPYIGTGANGYTKDDIHEALDDVMFEYQFKPGIKINIVSIIYNETSAMDKSYTDFDSYHSSKRSGLNLNMVKDAKSISDVSKPELTYIVKKDLAIKNIEEATQVIMSNYNNKDEYSTIGLNRPIDFLNYIRHEKDYPKSVNEIISSNSLKNMGRTKTQRTLKKYELLAIAERLKLNFTQIIQLMTIFSFTFSPLSEDGVDYDILHYIALYNGFQMSDCDTFTYFRENYSKTSCDALCDGYLKSEKK